MTKAQKLRKASTRYAVARDAKGLLDVLEVEKKGMSFKSPDRLTVAMLKLERSLNNLR